MAERACCDQIVEVQATSVDHERRIATLEGDFATFVKEIRDAMQYRLPLWATFAMTTMGGFIGYLIKR